MKHNVHSQYWDYAAWTDTIDLSGNKPKFYIVLNPEFATLAISLLPHESSESEFLLDGVKKKYPKRFASLPDNVFDFVEDTALLRCLYLEAGNGVWLNSNVLKAENIPKDDKPIIFSPHNLLVGSQAISFQILFQHWVQWVRYGNHRQR